MSEYQSLSRSERYSKRRNNNRKIFFFMALAILFLIILFFLISNGSKDKGENETSLTTHEQEDEIEENEEHDDIETSLESKDINVEEDEINEQSFDDVVIQKVDSTDENVIEAFTGNWPAVGTEQEGPHTTNYSEGSDDRLEIKRAVSMVTNIEEDDMIEWRVENGGEQKVIATISNKEKTEYYRIYLSWMDGEGWRPTKAEKIKEYTS